MSESAVAGRLAADLQDAARCLVMHPLVAGERHPEDFALIRRHHQRLDQWFTQRFGYRLHVTADTARLYKTTVVPRRRPLRTVGTQPRAFTAGEYRALALALAAVVSGPSVISLRDLIRKVQTAAAEAGVEFGTESSDRRALVTALRWMIAHGLATELHEHVDALRDDEGADAVLETRPDRIALLPLPSLSDAETADQLLDRSESRRSLRSWMRAQLLEEPAVYRDDLDDASWSELRRRLGEEADFFDEMFGMRIEARAEGVMVIDPDRQMSDVAFPVTGTVGHAALLLADRLVACSEARVSCDAVTAMVAELAVEHQSYWSQLRENPERLAREALDLLADHRLAEFDGGDVVVLPAAARYAMEVTHQEVSLL